MNEKTLVIDNIEINKKKFHQSKQLIYLDLVDTNNIVISDKFKYSDDGFKYFIGYKEDNIVKPLYIILPQMSGYIKYFEIKGKILSFGIKDDSVLDKCNKIRNKIKKTLNIKFHSILTCDETFIKAKTKEFNGVIKTSFLDSEVPREGVYYTCIACISIDYIMKMGKINYLQVHLEECKYKIKEGA